MRFSRFVSLAPLVLLAACATKPAPPLVPPAPVPTPTPTPTPTPQPTYANWEDAPQTPGDWSYANGTATFGRPGAPLFALACARGSIEIAMSGAAAGPITVRTETITRTLAAPSIGARDPLLDAIAFSKGRFAVEMAGAPTLYLPSYPEISRVIEDCR